MASQTEARLGHAARFVPHFEVTTIDGRHVRYSDVWQRKNLVLILVPPQERDDGSRYTSRLEARREEFEREEATIVATADPVPTLQAPAILVADRWGEVVMLETASNGQTFRWPEVDELLSWLHFIEIQCPECPP